MTEDLIEVVSEFEKIANGMHAGVEQKLGDFRAEVLREIRQKTARPPAAFGGVPETRATPLLAADQKFADWLRQGRSRSSAYTASFKNFRLDTKATITSPAMPVRVGEIFGQPEQGLRLTELLPTVNLSSGGMIEFVQESSFVPNAGIQVNEGDVKPSTSIDFAPKTAKVQTIASILKVSTQAIADTIGLLDWLDARLAYSVKLKAEDHLLNAASDGLMANAAALDPLFAPGTGATQLDAIGSAIAQLEAAGYSVDGVVMSGSDVNKMRLLKNNNGDYVWARPSQQIGTASVWSTPLVVSPSMPSGQFLVGAFAQSTVLYSRQTLIVEVAFENEDDFIRNLACLRAEERIALAVMIPSALLKGTFPVTPPATLSANRK